MGEGGGGPLSLFRFHLSPFPPETPDTQAKNGVNMKQQTNIGERSPGEGGYSTNVYTGRLRPEVQPLTLLYTIFLEKGTPGCVRYF